MALLTFSWLIDVTMFLLTILIAAYLYMTRNFNYWKKRGVVEIPPVPFFGNLGKYCTLQMSPAFLFKNFYDQSENLPYVGIYNFDKPCLVLRDPEIIKQVLVKDFNSFSDKYQRSSKNDDTSNNCLLVIDNPYWKYIRNKFSNLFTPTKLKCAYENGQDVAKDFNDYIDSLELKGSGKKVNVRDFAADFTTDFIGLSGFGLKLNSLRDPNAEFRQSSKKMSGTYNLGRAMELNCVSLTPQFSTLFDCRFFEKHSCEFFRKAFQEIINEREMKKIKRNDFIDLLIQLKNINDSSDDSHGFKFEGNNLLGQALLLFTAGYDTSSATISFALYELARNPDIQSKLRIEINEGLEKNNGNLSYEMINPESTNQKWLNRVYLQDKFYPEITELRYLDMVIAETLRMYATVPVIDRKATKDCKIEKTGLLIEKGTPIFVPVFGLQYDAKYYPNPEVFDPERFSDLNKSSMNPYVYLPFGIGPRNCIGMRQGLLQSKLGIALIVSRFEVTLSKDSSSVVIDPKSYFTVAKGGLFLNIRKIDAQSNK